jgi:hypothetical protein
MTKQGYLMDTNIAITLIDSGLSGFETGVLRPLILLEWFASAPMCLYSMREGIHMKLFKLNNEELSNAIISGDTYIQVGSRKFMLFEVDEISLSGNYEVTDPEEETLLLDAMHADNPSLSKQEVLEQLARRNRQ